VNRTWPGPMLNAPGFPRSYRTGRLSLHESAPGSAAATVAHRLPSADRRITIVLVSNRASVPSAQQFAPVVSVTTLLALTLATVFGFVAYLHGVVRLMRVQYLLEAIATEGRLAIEENFPPASSYVDAEPPAPAPAPRCLYYAGTPGVISATDLHGLAELCRRKDCWLELTVGVGEYLAHGTPVAVVHGGDPDTADVTRYFLIGGERTFVQDPAFGFRQLVDVAIRALSPAVNDPTTGVQAIDRIGDLLAITGRRPDPAGLRIDAAGTVRVKRKLRDFEGLLVLSMTEVIRYGADAPQVVRRLHGMLDELEATLPAERHAALARQRSLLEAAVSAALPAPFAPPRMASLLPRAALSRPPLTEAELPSARLPRPPLTEAASPATLLLLPPLAVA
jgi:uncharacterized membrane protein